MRKFGPAVIAGIGGLVFIADQVTKYLVRTYLAPAATSVNVIGEIVRLTFTRNEGAAFGMLQGNVYLFIPVHVVVILVVAAYAWRRRPERPWLIVALGLLAGGALGNLVDRVVFGWVTDFIRIPFDFPVFNVADSAIVVGVAMLVWWLLFGPTARPAHVQGTAQGTDVGAGEDRGVEHVQQEGTGDTSVEDVIL